MIWRLWYNLYVNLYVSLPCCGNINQAMWLLVLTKCRTGNNAIRKFALLLLFHENGKTRKAAQNHKMLYLISYCHTT